MKEHFDQIIPLPLSEKWRGFFKLRVGKWRIIYEVEEGNKTIVIHRIGPRNQIYRI